MNGSHKPGSKAWSLADLFALLLVGVVVAYGVPQFDQRPFRQAADWVRQIAKGRASVATEAVAPPSERPVTIAEPLPQPNIAAERKPDFKFSGDGRFAVRETDSGLLISLAGAAPFDSGSATLKPELEELLAVIAERVRSIPNQIVLLGHTDGVPIQTADFGSNQELSLARANRVRGFLAQRGVDPGRIVATGFGDSRPEFPNDTPQGRSKNRRVDVLIMREGTIADAGQETDTIKK